MNFLPISSYGFIGNLGSCALVGVNGSIDWCCLPRLDSPSVFAAILDPEKGGSFSIVPHDVVRSAQAYIPDTNILQTTFVTPAGVLTVTDWMHVGVYQPVEHNDHRQPLLYRIIDCTEGQVDVRVHFDPLCDYARCETVIRSTESGIAAESRNDILSLHTDLPMKPAARGAECVARLKAGQSRYCICSYGRTDPQYLPSPKSSRVLTQAYWHAWLSEGRQGAQPFLGKWRDHAIRSSLALKILAGGNGIAAAATTSLPETMGGGDNWDYRFNWIRDTSFTIQALSALGHFDDGREFLDWIRQLLLEGGRRPADLQILYPLYGHTSLAEEELTHLCGYRNSRPVRIGNGAAHQRQLDIYGEILDAIYRSEYLHPGVENVLSTVLTDIVNFVCDIWRETDSGIWELRVKPRHYTYSKVMCWVAIDRGIKLAIEHQWPVDLTRWKAECDALRDMIMERGFHPKRKAFTQSFDGETLDATALLFPLLEFIPADHPYAIGTLNEIQRSLARGPLVYRSEEHVDKEGAFGFCCFWLVDALVLAGRTDEARDNFSSLLTHANHVGLYAEEIDPDTGGFLGNFPQAFTHVGLINSILYLARATKDIPAPQPLMGEGM